MLTDFFLSNHLSNKFINHQNSERRTPLHLAVIHTHIPCIDLLLQTTEIDLDVPDFNRWTPLHYAISLGSTATVRYLLERGAKFDSDHFKAITSVAIAVEKEYIGLLRVKYKHIYIYSSV